MQLAQTVTDSADELREGVKESPGKLAVADRDRSEWITAFEALGLDLRDPIVAGVAFATTQCLLWHLVDSAADVVEFGERLIDGAIACAWYVS